MEKGKEMAKDAAKEGAAAAVVIEKGKEMAKDAMKK